MLKLGMDLLNLIYPVGSIYMSVNSTNPSDVFGGTWSMWGNGRVPVGVDEAQTEFNTAGKTGGSKTHTLSENEIPSHQHRLRNENPNDKTTPSVGIGEGTGALGGLRPSNTSWATSFSGYLTSQLTGGGQAHNNLQPYITCYMWKRTA